MAQTFPEVVIGGVLLSPFVRYAVIAMLVYLLLRPFLYLIRFDRAFSNAPVAELSVYVLILMIIIVCL